VATERAALEKLAAELGLERVQFHPLQSRERFPEVLAAADVALVTLSPSGGRVSTQGKLYSLLAAGRPVIAVVPEGNAAARILEEGGCGWSVRPEEPGTLACLLGALAANRGELEEKGRAARRLFEERYSLEVPELFDEALDARCRAVGGSGRGDGTKTAQARADQEMRWPMS
jgi:colanic acid biosynthesis glycosyl transferase WcaI